MDRKKSDSDEIWVNKFDEEAARDFRDDLISASKIDPSRPLIIYIDSYGGMVDSLASMIETMDEVPNPLITVCHGKAMSCGAILLSHGDIRFCGKHSRVLIHEISAGTSGDVHDIYADAQEIKRQNAYFMGLLAKNCGISGGYEALRKLIKSQDGRDKTMNAQEALEFGIVDAVGTPIIESSVRYNLSLAPVKKTLDKSAIIKHAATATSNLPKKSTSVTKSSTKSKKKTKTDSK
jgi:ATP-dependent Clp endopeptidase proteolytic subunit ClpP